MECCVCAIDNEIYWNLFDLSQSHLLDYENEWTEEWKWSVVSGQWSVISDQRTPSTWVSIAVVEWIRLEIRLDVRTKEIDDSICSSRGWRTPILYFIVFFIEKRNRIIILVIGSRDEKKTTRCSDAFVQSLLVSHCSTLIKDIDQWLRKTNIES